MAGSASRYSLKDDTAEAALSNNAERNPFPAVHLQGEKLLAVCCKDHTEFCLW